MSSQHGKGSGYKGKGKGKKKGKNVNIEYNGESLTPARKCFVATHPDVEDRLEHENETIRRKHGILVTSSTSTGALPPPIKSLEESPFPDWVRRPLRQNFKEPTAIQVQAWTAAMQGCDVVGIAETGSGKTLAYVLPMLVHVEAQKELEPGDGPIGLVVLPTHNLCNQVTDVICMYARHCEEGLICKSAETISSDDQCHIMVGTPYRLLDIIRQGEMNLRRTTFVVLDEGDELILGKGLGEQIRELVRAMRPDRQVLLFGASWSEEARQVADDVMKCDPVSIVVGDTKATACKNIRQHFKLVRDMDKKELLVERITDLKDKLSADFKALVFVNRRDMLLEVLDAIKAQIPTAEAYGDHGRTPHSELDAVLNKFRSPDSDCHVLVATQVLGRGLDIPEIKWVINFDMPMKIVEYIHRIGRTGRAGQIGDSWTLLEDHDLHNARDLADCLRDSEHVVPPEITRACKEWRRYKEVHKEWVSKQQEAKEMRNPGSDEVDDSNQVNDKISLDLRTSGEVQFRELRNTPCGPQYYCTLCNLPADRMHDVNEQHLRRLQMHREPQKDRAAELTRGLQRYYADDEKRYYWHDPATGISSWETETNVPPENLEAGTQERHKHPAVCEDPWRHPEIEPIRGKPSTSVDALKSNGVGTHERHKDRAVCEDPWRHPKTQPILGKPLLSVDAMKSNDVGTHERHKDRAVCEDPWRHPETESILGRPSLSADAMKSDGKSPQARQRVFDETYNRHYWFDPVTGTSEWEIDENTPPQKIDIPTKVESTPRKSPLLVVDASTQKSEAEFTGEAKSQADRYHHTNAEYKAPAIPCNNVEAASKARQRVFDDTHRRYYWYDPVTKTSEWEIDGNESQQNFAVDKLEHQKKYRPPASMTQNGSAAGNDRKATNPSQLDTHAIHACARKLDVSPDDSASNGHIRLGGAREFTRIEQEKHRQAKKSLQGAARPQGDALDPWCGEDKKVCELRDTSDGPVWWCTVCKASAEEGHLSSERHLQNKKRMNCGGQTSAARPVKVSTDSRALQKDTFELRSTRDAGPQYWCLLCQEWAGHPLHVTSDKHVTLLEQRRQRRQPIVDPQLDPWMEQKSEVFNARKDDREGQRKQAIPASPPRPQPASACQAMADSNYELRNNGSAGPQYFCKLCNQFADAAHSTTLEHLLRRAQWFENYKVPENFERHLDAETGRYYWFNQKTGISKWEIDDNTPPSFS